MFKKSGANKTKQPENFDKAYEYAVFLLSLRLRSEAEVREKMLGRGYAASITDDVIGRLKEQKYLDDQKFAEVFLENLKQYKGFGFYGIKKKMAEKKLPQKLVDKILAEGLPVSEEIKIARRLLKKEGVAVKEKSDDGELQYRAFGDQDDQKQKQKLAQKLKSRGFRGEVLAKVLF